MDAKTLETVSPTAAIYERIRGAISGRKLRPGTRLKEEELSTIFSTSRARVRQALAALERDGLVTIVPNRGAFVAEPSIGEARDVFFARRVVEAGLIGRLCDTATQEMIAQLRKHVAEERSSRARGDLPAVVRLGGGFHMLIAEMAGSPHLRDVLRDLISRTELIKTMYQPRSSQDCGPDEHEAVVEGIARGDKAAATGAMEHHLLHTENELEFDYNEDRPRDLQDILG